MGKNDSNGKRTHSVVCRGRRDALAAGLYAALLPWLSEPAWALPQVGSIRLDEVDGSDGSGQRDSTAALQKALATGKPVYVPSGEFLVGGAALPAGSTVYGPGTLKQIPGAMRLFEIDSGSSAVSQNVRDITLRGLTLMGTVEREGFFEHSHLFAASGISNLTIEDVRFVGFRGDGLYLGSGSKPKLERHNTDVVIRRCLFDGLNRQNRNGVSAIDCDGLLIEDTEFRNCSARNMPGPIDLEPNDNGWHLIRRVIIRRNRFVANGGNSGQISIYQPRNVHAAPHDILIDGNDFSEYSGSGGDVTMQVRRRLEPSDRDTMLRIVNNRGKHGFRPLRIYSGRGILIQGNVWEDYAANAQLGHVESTDFVENVVIRDNRFVRCGSSPAGRYGLSIFSGANVTLEVNQFIDCGDGAPGSYALQFNRGSTRGLKVIGNRFDGPTGKTRVAMLRESTHEIDERSADFSKNIVGPGIQRGNTPGE